MSQATIPTGTVHTLPTHPHHFTRAVLAALGLLIAIAVALVVLAWTNDSTPARTTVVPKVSHVIPKATSVPPSADEWVCKRVC